MALQFDHHIYELLFLIFLGVLARLFFVSYVSTTGHNRQDDKKRTKPCKTLICMGSGGHTSEMLKLLEQLDFKNYSPRSYIVANNDTTSYDKIRNLEKEKGGDDYRVIEVPRSRVVNQSYITSIFTTLYSIACSIPVVLFVRPDLILCNGPGTCIPICIVAFLMKAAFIKNVRIVFIESFCRTKTFSLSGKILMYMADNFLVQWPSLKKKLRRSEYIGQLM